jgi:hypothetical protein
MELHPRINSLSEAETLTQVRQYIGWDKIDEDKAREILDQELKSRKSGTAMRQHYHFEDGVFHIIGNSILIEFHNAAMSMIAAGQIGPVLADPNRPHGINGSGPNAPRYLEKDEFIVSQSLLESALATADGETKAALEKLLSETSLKHRTIGSTS